MDNEIFYTRSANEMLASQTEQLEAIRTSAGYSKDKFDKVFLPLLRHYALNVQNLPLAVDYFHKPGGAWEFGLSMAIVTLNVAQSRMFFPSLPSHERTSLEQQSVFAAFLAGLATGVAVLTQNTRITDEDGNEFHILTAPESLHDWIVKAKTPKFNWRTIEQYPSLTSPECAAIGARFLPSYVLRPFDLRIVRSVYGAIHPMSAPNALQTTLSKVVMESMEAIIKQYKQKWAASFNPALRAAEAPTAKETSMVANTLVQASNQATPIMSLDDIQMPAAKAPKATVVSLVQPSKESAISPDVRHTSISGLDAPEPPTDGVVLTAEDYLTNAPGALQDWFKFLHTHEKYEAFKSQIVVSETGVELPIALLSDLGMRLETLVKLMREAEIFVGMNKNAPRIILIPAVKPLFFAET